MKYEGKAIRQAANEGKKIACFWDRQGLENYWSDVVESKTATFGDATVVVVKNSEGEIAWDYGQEAGSENYVVSAGAAEVFGQ